MTETVSTERLEELLRLEIEMRDQYIEGSFLWLKHEDKANAFAELIAKRSVASRTQSPTEWQVERFDHIYRFEDGFGSSEMVERENGGYVKFSDYAALRAATPPASPVPLSVTDETERNILAWVRDDVLPAYGITHNTRASDPEMVEGLRAAISKPGEQG